MRSTDRWLARRVTIDRADLVSDLDLGDVALPAARTVQLRIVRPDGEPARNAIAIAAGMSRISIDELVHADRDGRIEVRVPADTAAVFVGSEGLESARVELDSGHGEILVRLRRTNALAIRVVGASGGRASGVLVRVRTDGNLFPEPAAEVAELARWTGSKRSANPGADESELIHAWRGSDIVVSGVVVDRPLLVEAVDATTGAVLASKAVQVAAAERREVELAIEHGTTLPGSDGMGFSPPRGSPAVLDLFGYGSLVLLVAVLVLVDDLPGRRQRRVRPPRR